MNKNALYRLLHALWIPDKALWYRYLFALLSIALFIYLGFIKSPVRYGDGYEYLYTSRAIQNHATPDLRSGDIASIRGALEQFSIPVSEGPRGFYPALSGASYSYHFWLYSAFNVPFMALWELVFSDPIRSFHVFNTLLFLIALWVFDRYATIEQPKKILALGLLAFNPILWYLSWWMPEAFTYSLMILSLTAFTRKQFALATTLAAVASTQNPPVLFGAVFFGIAGLLETWHSKRFLDILKFIPAGLFAIAPWIFYWGNYGTPNLILSLGFAKTELISFQRLFDLLFDLNLGVLAFLPAVALLFSACLLSDLIRRRWMQWIFPIVIFAMCLSAAQTTNWNPGMAGIHRYAIWLVPWLVFYIFTHPLARWDKWSAAAGIAVQVVIFISFGGFLQNVSYTRFTPASQVLMNIAPALYSPDPEIFYERAKDSEGLFNASPSLYISPKNAVKKIWTDLAGFERLARLNNIALDIADPQRYHQIKAQLAANPGNQYVNLDAAIILLKADPSISIQGLKYQLEVQNPPPSIMLLTENIILTTRITNTGDMPWFSFQGKDTLVVFYQWVVPDETHEKSSAGSIRLPNLVFPGETIDLPFRVPCPPRVGEYLLELDLVWNNLAFFSDAGTPKTTFRITFTNP